MYTLHIFPCNTHCIFTYTYIHHIYIPLHIHIYSYRQALECPGGSTRTTNEKRRNSKYNQNNGFSLW